MTSGHKRLHPDVAVNSPLHILIEIHTLKKSYLNGEETQDCLHSILAVSSLDVCVWLHCGWCQYTTKIIFINSDWISLQALDKDIPFA